MFPSKISTIGPGPVVLVDDEKRDRFIAQRCFTKSLLQTNHDFIEFSDGPSFLDYLSNEVIAGKKPMPALVLIDINMPSMNGFDVIERVRGNPQFKDQPLLMVFSTSRNPSDLAMAGKLGADGYQVKPFSLEEYIDFFNSLA